LSSSHAWALLGVQVKEDIFKWITMNITWGSSIGRYFEVDNYEHYLGFKQRKIFSSG
jgi:hypothetical protein